MTVVRLIRLHSFLPHDDWLLEFIFLLEFLQVLVGINHQHWGRGRVWLLVQQPLVIVVMYLPTKREVSHVVGTFRLQELDIMSHYFYTDYYKNVCR